MIELDIEKRELRGKVLSEKITKRIKKALKFLGIIAIIIFFSVILGFIFPDNSKSIYGISSWIVICYIMLKYFDFAFRLSVEREISSLDLRANATKKNLYQWLGNANWDDFSIYQWLKEEERADITSNLSAIKESIKTKVGNDIYDYYLLKNYLEYYGKHNFLNSVWKTFGVVTFGGLAGVFAKLGVLDEIYGMFKNSQKDSAILEQVELIIQAGVMLLITLITFIFVKNELTKEKRRIDLLTGIIDVIIKEEEEKVKNL